MNKDIVIFGAGAIGQKALKAYGERVAYFIDNSQQLNGSYIEGVIVKSVEEGVQNAAIRKIVIASQYREAMAKQLVELGVSNYVYYTDEIEELYSWHINNYLSNLLKERHSEDVIEKVKKIKFLTAAFNADKEKKPGGGPLGAICMQKKCLGESYEGIELEYPYYTDAGEKIPEHINKYPYMTKAIEAVMEMCREDRNTIYVVNDIFSAFGLYILGKKYSLIFHAQGDIVTEMTMWGNRLSENTRKVIYEIETKTVENAHRVLFPSKGAEQYFRKSFKTPLVFTGGEPVYNTITDFPVPCELKGIERDENSLTFLSIGQMTKLKGMDRIPSFLQKYIECTNQRVRWIVVADGVLKREVAELARNVQKETGKLEYVNIDYKITHAQIFYLLNLCDAYLMLHRVSIFDFATLEAMYCEKPVILSDIPGNDEYNQEQNILLVGENPDMKNVSRYIADKAKTGRKNREVYDNYFAMNSFIERYAAFMEEFIRSAEE